MWLAASFLCGLLAYFVARRKGKPRKWWVPACALFPPSLLLLVLTNSRTSNSEGLNAVLQEWWSSPRTEKVGIALAFGLCLVSLIGFGSDDTLPECHSSRAQTLVENTLEQAPFGRVYGLSVVQFYDVRQEERSDWWIDCNGKVALNNGSFREIEWQIKRGVRGGLETSVTVGIAALAPQ